MKKENFLSFLTKPVSRIELMIAGILVAPLILASVVSAATTISTNIVTGGTISVNANGNLVSMAEQGFGIITGSADGRGIFAYNGSDDYVLGAAGGNGATAVIVSAKEGLESLYVTVADQTAMSVTNSHNIGIGTTTPTEKLVVQGNLKVTGTTNGVKVYRATLNQTGTNAPVATVLENSLGGTVVWTRNSEGNYSATLAGAFSSGKTFLKYSSMPDTIAVDDAPIYVQFKRNTVNDLLLTTGNPDGNYDSQLGAFPVEILVYP